MTFRASLASWLAANVTPSLAAAGRRPVTASNLSLLRGWNRSLADAGWAAPAWPSVHGGRDAGIEDQLAYLEEMARFDAPGPINSIGVANIAPAIMQYGTVGQCARFLRPLLRGDEIWSQGMSEPSAGSDLASLRTSAVLEDDHFVINGQKTWNSLGHLADWCQLYVRTGAAGHKGISCLLVDMRTPGIEVRPITTITGDHAFSDVYFSDAHVPASALLGGLHEGWRVAMTTLSYERAGVARLHLGLSRKLRDLRAVARVEDPVARDRLASIYSQIACMRWMTDRALAGGEPSSTSGSLTKLAWARADQALAELAVSLLGPAGLDGPWASNLTNSRQTSIAGGTTEINKNIVAEHGLGLPRF
jgi:alkylation response protein AidB-like acyl-CoA dehydrogenase